MNPNNQGPVVQADAVKIKGGWTPGVTVPVPPEQAWLFYKLDKQERILGGIRSWVTFMGILIIIGIVLAACSALGLR